MGQPAEQSIMLIEATSEAIAKNQPEPTNYWWLLTLAIAPVIFAWWLRKRK